MSSSRRVGDRHEGGATSAHQLFADGTLLLPEITEVVLGRRPLGRAATLTGYARFRMRGERFPALVAQVASQTGGLVFDDIAGDELDTLDAYEGEMYQRVAVQVVLAEGGASDAWVYLLRPEHLDHLSAEHWDLERFAAEEVERFMREEFG